MLNLHCNHYDVFCVANVTRRSQPPARDHFPDVFIITAMDSIRLFVLIVACAAAWAQRGGFRDRAPATTYLLKPARVFDGENMQQGWAVRVRGERIEAAGPAASIDAAGAKV